MESRHVQSTGKASGEFKCYAGGFQVGWTAYRRGHSVAVVESVCDWFREEGRGIWVILNLPKLLC